MRLVRVALAAVLGVMLAACGDGAQPADISSSAEVTSTQPSTTAGPTTTEAPTTTGSSTTVRRSTASTVAVTTTRRPATTRPPTTTTVTTGASVPCSAAQLAVEVTTDKPSYRPGETVRVQGTLRNQSGAACSYTSYTGSQEIAGPSGAPVRPSSIFIADAFRDTPLPAGATLTQSPTWDQQACPTAGGTCAQAAPGTYTAKVGWGFGGAPVEGSATFQLAA